MVPFLIQWSPAACGCGSCSNVELYMHLEGPSVKESQFNLVGQSHDLLALKTDIL